MSIIIPAHTTRAKPVVSYQEIKEEADRAQSILHIGNFAGQWKDGFALAHAQISREPWSFFVVHKSVVKEFDDHYVLCNIRIVDKRDEVGFKEACLSFPFRQLKKTRRWHYIKVMAEVPIEGVLTTITLDLYALPAFIVQHEIEHANGENIYKKFK